MRALIEKFNSVNSLKVNLETEIDETEKIIQEYFNLLEEKIRTEDKENYEDPEFLALKEKLTGNSESKSKKSEEKKTSKSKKNC